MMAKLKVATIMDWKEGDQCTVICDHRENMGVHNDRSARLKSEKACFILQITCLLVSMCSPSKALWTKKKK